MARDKSKPQFRHTPDEIMVEDTGWLHLGQLRALVQMADDRGWPDSALISHGVGGSHPWRHDIRVARCLVIEGNDPTPPVPDTEASRDA